MFSRNKITGGNQNYSGNHGQTINPSNPFPSGNNSYNQQGGGKYQPNITFKSSGFSMNEPYKSSTIPLSQSTQNTQQYDGQNQPLIQPPRLKPILKQTLSLPPQNNPPSPSPRSITPTKQPIVPPEPSTSSVDSDDNKLDKDEEMPMEIKELSRWKRNKVTGSKVNRKLKRLRMNQRLRKTLMPKNAIMVLNEIKAGVQFSFPDNQSMINSMFLAHARLEGKTYVGQGLSKLQARQNAAENALKSLLLGRMTAAALKAKIDDDNENSQFIKDSESESSFIEMGNGDEHDEVPWSSLASFALHKLFLEWQNQGTVVPIPRPGVQQPVKIKSEPKLPVEKKLPANATSVHPVMLLNQMRPGAVYTAINQKGTPPNTLFTLSVEVDDKSFSGEAKNKKDAKKMAAKNALAALFDLKYTDNDNESNISDKTEVNE